MKRFVCHSVMLLAVGTAGCSDDDEAITFTAVSYNGGLARGFVPGAVERTPLVASAVAGLEADVVCLQEIWFDDDVAAVAGAAAGSFPTAIFPAPTGGGMTGEAACTEMDLQPLLDCGTANGCDTACGDELVTCVITHCGMEFSDLTENTPNCGQCLQANVGNPIADIVETCTSASTEFAFGGSFGIGLLTSAPVLAQEELVLDSTTNRRGVIYAKLDTALGPVHTFCTHLTAVFDETEIPYPRPEGSWEEEQGAQIEELIAWASEKAGGEPVVLMGDFNTGPAGNGYVAEFPAHYDAVTAAGYAAPYVEQGNPCTFCAANPLVGSDHDGSVLIDHVFARGLAAATGSGRVLDQIVTVPICEVETEAALSDHYGVSVTFGE